MPTTQQDKPAAKPRQRSRKADSRGRKGEQPTREALDRLDQAVLAEAATTMPKDLPADDKPALGIEAEPMVEIEAEPLNVEAEPLNVEAEPMVEARMEVAIEPPAVPPAPLSGEVLPPVRSAGTEASQIPIGPLAIVESWGNYTRKSVQARKAFFDRLMKVRSLEDAVEAHSEFARLTYANFLTESCKLFELYGEWTRQWLRPFENAPANWTRSVR